VSSVHTLNGSQKLPAEVAKAKELRVQLRATKAIPHFTLGRADTKPTAQGSSTLTRALRTPARDAGKASDKAVPLFHHKDLRSGEWAMGPAIVEEEYFTCVVPAGWRFLVNDNRDLVLNKKSSGVAS
jgi:N-methylhydantoinase A/oxoprolinase/acetone carboxylase beta subunit